VKTRCGWPRDASAGTRSWQRRFYELVDDSDALVRFQLAFTLAELAPTARYEALAASATPDATIPFVDVTSSDRPKNSLWTVDPS